MKNMLSEVIVSLILAMFGIFLILWADKVTDIFSILAGVVIAVYGIIKIINYYNKKDDAVDLILGIIIIVLGGVLIFNASLLKETISFVLGLYILITSASNLILSTKSESKTPLILSIVGIIIGLLCIVGKFIVPDVFLQIIGWILVIYAGISIINAILLQSESKSEN